MLNVCPNMTLISVPHSSLFIHSSVEPFPLESVPGYLDVVDKKLDLKTLSSNLEGGLYNSRQDFFEDASLIFTNAIKYHGARETKANLLQVYRDGYVLRLIVVVGKLFLGFGPI